MNKKIIIGLVGEMAGGKGTVSDYLKEKYNASSYTFSQMLRDILNRLYLEISRENLIKLSEILRKDFGQNLMAKTMARDVKNDSNKIIIVDGVRRMEDVEFLEKNDNFILVSVKTDLKIRYERLLKRSQNKGDNKKTYKEFVADHEKETEKIIPEIMKTANKEINNDKTLKELHDQIDILIKKYE